MNYEQAVKFAVLHFDATPCGRGWVGTKPPGCKRPESKGEATKKTKQKAKTTPQKTKQKAVDKSVSKPDNKGKDVTRVKPVGKTKAFPDLKGSLREPAQVDLDSITGVEPLKLSSAQKTHFNSYAESIAELGAARVPAVFQKGIEEFGFVDKQGEIDYHAYQAARKMNPTLPDRMRVMIIKPENKDSVSKQVNALKNL